MERQHLQTTVQGIYCFCCFLHSNKFGVQVLFFACLLKWPSNTKWEYSLRNLSPAVAADLCAYVTSFAWSSLWPPSPQDWVVESTPTIFRILNTLYPSCLSGSHSSPIGSAHYELLVVGQECCYRHRMEELCSDLCYLVILNGKVDKWIITCASLNCVAHSLNLWFDRV